MTTFLVQHGLTADQVADLDNGPYVRGDVTEIPGLCGNTAKPPAVLVPLTTGTDPRPAQVAVETDGRTIRPRTAVVLTLSPR